MTPHDFKAQLKYSEESSDKEFWQKVYTIAFPSMVSNRLTGGDMKLQRLGIDRIVTLSNGANIKIDEKKRREARNDILIEYISVDTTGAPGWIEKDLAIDYIAYAFMPIQRVYLFPWQNLRRAWLRYKPYWLADYRPIIAQNRGYKTISVAVPISVLANAIWQASIIQLPVEVVK